MRLLRRIDGLHVSATTTMRYMLFLCLAVVLISTIHVYGQNERIEERQDTVNKEGAVGDDRRALNNLSTAALVNILEEYGIDMGDEQYSKEELVQYVQILFREIEKKGLEIPTEFQHEEADNEPLADVQGNNSHEASVTHSNSSTNPSVWELVKAQVQSDLAPFLLLLPKPLKTFVQAQAIALWATAKASVRGAVGPMVQTAGRVIRCAGYWLIGFSDTVVEHGKRLNKDNSKANQAR